VDLAEYIRQIGDEAAAKLLEVNVRTVRSWRYKSRWPRRKTAQRIVRRTPLKMEDIYGR
jgi:hypothetical protein